MVPVFFGLSVRTFVGTFRVYQEALTAEAKPRRRARSDRLKAKHIAKQEELAKQGVSEEEWRERDADLTRMEELDAEVRLCFKI